MLAGVFEEWRLGDIILFEARSEREIRNEIWRAVRSRYGRNERNITRMLDDSWRSGLKAGRLPLELYQEDFEILQLCSGDLVFHDAWCGVTTAFPSAVEAKGYVLERLAAAGCVDVDAIRILRAGDILDAVANEIAVKLILEPFTTEGGSQ